MRERHSERGFTLVETLVGMAILSASLITTYSSISNALKATYRLAERREAVEEVQQQVDMLRQQPFIRVEFMEGETNAYKWQVSIELMRMPSSKNIMPFRIVGQLTSKSIYGRPETVVDTIMIGRRA